MFNNFFGSAQSILSLLAGLVTLAEGQGNGQQKQQIVLGVINEGISALPLSGTAGTIVKAVATAVAPTIVNLVVAHGNATGALPAATSTNTSPQ